MIAMLHGHSDRVNCVTWTRGDAASSSPWLLSGAADNNIIVWKCVDEMVTCITVLIKVLTVFGHYYTLPK